MDSTVCLRCGETVTAFHPHLRSVMRLQPTPPDERASMLAEWESVPLPVASAWLHHRYHQACAPKVAHCAFCKGTLTTWQAQWCQHCGLDWHPARQADHA